MKSAAWRITGIYLLIGALWILFSDQLLGALAADAQALTRLSMLKGWFYVLVTGLILFQLIDRRERARARVEAELREGENRFREIIRHDPSAVAVLDREGRVLFASDRYLHDLGLEEKELLGRPYGDSFPGVPEGWREVKERCLAGSVERAEEDTLVLPGGRVEECRWLCRPWRDRCGELGGIVLYLELTTARKRLEAELLQARKLESIGRLAGGVAHDFNNILTAILGLVELAEYAPEREPSYLRRIREAGEKAAGLTRQLLAFARRQVVSPRLLDPNALILGLERLLRRLIGENLELATRLAEGIWPVRADPGQLEQVLVNLVVNARDAMPQGGTIVIATANVHLEDEEVEGRADAVSGPHVVIEVTDTGHGISKDALPHIFEPFFTTKRPGEGTGLGLATCYGIVRQAGGHIRVRTEPGRGASFLIHLPRAAGEPPADAGEAGAPVLGGAETLLLVEDDQAIREVTVRSLRRLGYTVLAAADGEEALRLAREHGGPIDLLVTDVVMPRLGGVGLAEELRALRAGMRVILTSGYPDQGIVDEGALPPGTSYLPKPFTPTQLARKAREVLGGGEGRGLPGEPFRQPPPNRSAQ